MTDDTAATTRVERESRPWSSQLPLIVLTAIVGAVFALAGTFGGRFVATSDTTLVLSTKVDQLLEQNKGQDAKLNQMDVAAREILLKMGALYTREEAARDREAAERRFQRLEQQMTEGGRRIDILEMTVRTLQQSFIDRTNKR